MGAVHRVGLFRFQRRNLTPNRPILRLDFFNDDPCLVSHALAIDFDHPFGDIFDKLGLLFLREKSLNDLYSCEWNSVLPPFLDRLTLQELEIRLV